MILFMFAAYQRYAKPYTLRDETFLSGLLLLGNSIRKLQIRPSDGETVFTYQSINDSYYETVVSMHGENLTIQRV